MRGKKSAYLCAVLSALFTLSILINDVNARAASSYRNSNEYSGSLLHPLSHLSSRDSVGSKLSRPNLDSSSHLRETRGSHRYPASNKLSGSRSTSAAHPSTNYGSNSGYPLSRPNSLSGSASGSTGHGYSSYNIQSSYRTQLGSVPSATLRPISGSGAYSYPNTRPNSLSGGGSGSSGYGYQSSNMQSNFGTQHGSAPYSSATFGANSGSKPHGYPDSPSNSLSGGASGSRGIQTGLYPQSNGYSGNTYSSNTHYNNKGGRTIVYNHHHYVYNPPAVIHYGSYGTQPISYPVYTGAPPAYILEYSSSKNKYNNLLAGLALYNLGRITATKNSQIYHTNYKPKSNEICKFGVQYKTGYFEEMVIQCWAITYFIYENEPQNHMTTNVLHQTTVTTQLMYSNGSLVQTQNNVVNGPGFPNMQTNSVTTSTTQVMSVSDPRFAGKSVEIKPDMECYVTRSIGFSNMKKSVPCELLQKYSTSIRNSGAMAKSYVTVILIAFVFALKL